MLELEGDRITEHDVVPRRRDALSAVRGPDAPHELKSRPAGASGPGEKIFAGTDEFSGTAQSNSCEPNWRTPCLPHSRRPTPAASTPLVIVRAALSGPAAS